MPAQTDIALLLLRIGAGLIFILHGLPKIKNPPAWGRHLGIPPITSFLVAIGEFFGGLGILFGFLTQIAAIGPLLVMLGALYYHKFKWGHEFISKEGKGFEYPFILAIIALTLILMGAGAYSIDAYLGF